MFKCFISIIFFSMILNGFQDYYGSYKIYDTLLVDKNLKIRAAEFSIYDKAENNNQPKLIYSEKILGFHLGGFNWTITERNEVIKFLKFDGSMVPGSDCSLIKYKI